ncbi:hypothetical protein V6N13_094494 [Hibiscus sabdariffa]|uniref:Uncharacterized protein n=1 Tax=Hibiscus sabdariffa TaxID=183260 RepID=A0ABR2PPQ8_9ROSI
MGHMSCTDIRAPRTSRRRNPKEWYDVAFHAEAQTVKRDRENPATSVSKWAASVRTARLLAFIPPKISTNITIR